MEQQQNCCFHDDIVLEILVRSSVKSLLRFMCVCKSWKSFISSYSFRKLHRERYTSTPPLFLNWRGRGGRKDKTGGVMSGIDVLDAFDLYGNFVQEYWNLPSGSCSVNLILMNFPSQSKLVCFKDYREKDFLLCNLSIRQSFPLPDPPCFSLRDFKRKTSAFGYIPSKDEYIMVHMVEKNPYDTWACEVLTFFISDDNFKVHFNEWRPIKVPTTMPNCLIDDSCVFACGAFYWIARSTIHKDDCFILSFDVETETLNSGVPSLIPSPYMELLELNDELYISKLPNYMSSTLELWKSSSDVNNKKLWTLYWNIDLQSVGCTIETSRSDLRILICRLKYLLGNIEPCNFTRELEKLKLQKHGEFMDKLKLKKHWDRKHWEFSCNMLGRIHTNLFTL